MLNNAASHSSMHTHGGAYVVETTCQNSGAMSVKSIMAALAEAGAGKKIEGLAKTKRQQLRYLIESADWSALPVHEQVFAEALYDDIDHFVRQIGSNAGFLEDKFAKLKSRIERLVHSGQITPTNGGIAGFLSSDDALLGNSQ
jgi:hypothetical protein